MERQKRYAGNKIVYNDQTIKNGVVTVIQSTVISYLPLCGEEANTIWLGGEIAIKQNESGGLQAFHNGVLLE
ncbi:MAG: hypothetical protein HXO18_10035 [Prevotella shahii]|uniref:hypothetical protein n=1 Tax=Hoylesella shahii TaxID=228603 RepID=UPI001CAEF80B|nr:hypothetical protein [Hoylesella shahii]MBF1569395.1 hypothetical protein [Hoylesella shahii]MBF1591392.1 hypothetical protein [Hoylesella shahii]